jgi:hypothetical protein
MSCFGNAGAIDGDEDEDDLSDEEDDDDVVVNNVVSPMMKKKGLVVVKNTTGNNAKGQRQPRPSRPYSHRIMCTIPFSPLAMALWINDDASPVCMLCNLEFHSFKRRVSTLSGFRLSLRNAQVVHSFVASLPKMWQTRLSSLYCKA